MPKHLFRNSDEYDAVKHILSRPYWGQPPAIEEPIDNDVEYYDWDDDFKQAVKNLCRARTEKQVAIALRKSAWYYGQLHRRTLRLSFDSDYWLNDLTIAPMYRNYDLKCAFQKDYKILMCAAQRLYPVSGKTWYRRMRTDEIDDSKEIAEVLEQCEE